MILVKKISPLTASLDVISGSSAGIKGWAEANIDRNSAHQSGDAHFVFGEDGPLDVNYQYDPWGQNLDDLYDQWFAQMLDSQPELGPLRSGKGLPPAAEDDRQGEQHMKKNNQDAPELKPRIVDCFVDIEERQRVLKSQQQQRENGKKNIGIYDANKLNQVIQEEWSEVRRDRAEAYRERCQARALNLFLRDSGAENSGGPLCGAWQLEDRGWTKVKVIMDSGAAESVCPRSMAPQFAIRDSAASKAGVYYTSANGGHIPNLGEQHVPVCLANGARTIATFQVAEVSRPLMSVARLCEMGNRILFGANGGVILNLKTGDVTPFQKEEGVYTFEMMIPPLSEAPFGRPRPPATHWATSPSALRLA